MNMTAKNYATNGFFVHADPGDKCNGFKMKNLRRRSTAPTACSPSTASAAR